MLLTGMGKTQGFQDDRIPSVNPLPVFFQGIFLVVADMDCFGVAKCLFPICIKMYKKLYNDTICL